MKKLILLISIAILATISSCKKECRKPEDIPVTKIEQEMYDWVRFDTGSYWIYIDSITGAYDSVYVTNVLLDTSLVINERKCVGQRKEELNIYMKSDYNRSEIKLSGKYGRGSGVSNNVNPVHGSVYIYDQKYSGGDGGLSKYMFFPVLQGTVGRWTGFGLIKHDTIYSEYEVLGKQYENVLQVHDNYNMALGYDTKFYHAKNVGVIRKEIYEINKKYPESKLLHVWELADYKVNQ